MLAEQREGVLKWSRASLVGWVEKGCSRGAVLRCWQQLNGWQTGVLAAAFLGKRRLTGICARIGADCRISSDTTSFECRSWPGFQQAQEAALRPILLELCFSWYLICMNTTWRVHMCADAAVHPSSCSSGLATSLGAVSLGSGPPKAEKKVASLTESFCRVFSPEMLVPPYGCRSPWCKTTLRGFERNWNLFLALSTFCVGVGLPAASPA